MRVLTDVLQHTEMDSEYSPLDPVRMALGRMKQMLITTALQCIDLWASALLT